MNAHILNEDRKLNAMKMEQAFYSQQANPDLRDIKLPKERGDVDIDVFIDKLKNVPQEELVLLADLLKT